MQAVHASEIAERAETHTIAPFRSATCSFTMSPQVPRLSRKLTFSPPFGHPKSLKIAVVPAVCAKVRARAPQNEKKRTLGGPRVPKGAKMEPKLRKIGTQNVQKNEVSQKSAKCGLDLLFTIYSHYWHPPKTSLFHTSKQQK